MSINIYKNQRFKDYIEASTVLEKYFSEHRQVFVVSNSDALSQAKYKKKVNLDCNFSRIIYSCKFGEEEKPKGNGLRKSRYGNTILEIIFMKIIALKLID